jgi:hypothetical protein
MVMMRVPVMVLLCQAVMGRVLVLEWPLSGVRGCLWLYPILSGI